MFCSPTTRSCTPLIWCGLWPSISRCAWWPHCLRGPRKRQADTGPALSICAQADRRGWQSSGPVLSMKILFFVRDLGIGGSQRQLALLAAGLARRGHDVAVAVLYGGG